MKFSASDLTKNITITVTISGFTGLKVRLYIAKNLIRLAAWVVGCGIKIVDETI